MSRFLVPQRSIIVMRECRLEETLPPRHLARFIWSALERIDFGAIEARYKSIVTCSGRPPYHTSVGGDPGNGRDPWGLLEDCIGIAIRGGWGESLFIQLLNKCGGCFKKGEKCCCGHLGAESIFTQVVWDEQSCTGNEDKWGKSALQSIAQGKFHFTKNGKNIDQNKAVCLECLRSDDVNDRNGKPAIDNYRNNQKPSAISMKTFNERLPLTDAAAAKNGQNKNADTQCSILFHILGENIVRPPTSNAPGVGPYEIAHPWGFELEDQYRMAHGQEKVNRNRPEL